MLPHNGLQFLENRMRYTGTAMYSTLFIIMPENTERFPLMTARIDEYLAFQLRRARVASNY